MDISPEGFLADRAPRRGKTNPERMQVPLWEWLVREGCSAYAVNERFQGPSACEAGPGWCFDRFGCSDTVLPDGRVVHIAGEHEDHYDADFYIYNDVIVEAPSGTVEIFGYPEDVFPPTDFHSATLVEGNIICVGNLGYPEQRDHRTTPVYRLDLTTFAMERVKTKGENPGWIRQQSAELEDDGVTLLVTRGTVESESGDRDNVDDFALCLTTGVWTRRTRRSWQQWSVRRQDGEPLLLFQMSNLAFQRKYPALRTEPDAELRDALEELGVELDPAKELEQGGRRFDASTFERLYGLPMTADHLEELEQFPVQAAFALDGATIRLEEGLDAIRVKVEGTLPDPTVEHICEDLRRKLEILQGAECDAILEGRQI